jgi:hypothetical protein
MRLVHVEDADALNGEWKAAGVGHDREPFDTDNEMPEGGAHRPGQ